VLQRWAHSHECRRRNEGRSVGVAAYRSLMSATPRNSPCPCGSGTKFKRCCMGRIERAGHALREHDRVGHDVVAWASEQHGESLDRLLSPSWPDRWRYRGRLWEQLFGTWAISDADPGDGGPPLARRYAERADLGAETREVARRIADARLELLRVRSVVPGAWIELEPLDGGEVTRAMSPTVSTSVAAGALMLARVMAGPPEPSLWGPVPTFPGGDERKWRARLAAHDPSSPQSGLELLRFDPEDHAEPLHEGLALVSAEWAVEDDELVCEDLALAPGVQELGREIGGGDDAWTFAWLALPGAAPDLGGCADDDRRIEAARIVVEPHRLVVRASAPALLREIGTWLIANVEGLALPLARAA
jgi:hypothetical protein